MKDKSVLENLKFHAMQFNCVTLDQTMGFSQGTQALRLKTLYFSLIIMETLFLILVTKIIYFDKHPKHFFVWLTGGGARPGNRLMGMCRWMRLHFYNWIDYNGVAFSIELLEWGHTFSGFWG